MWRDDAGGDQHHDEYEQADGQADAEGQGSQGAIGIALVPNKKNQSRAEAEQYSREGEQYDELDPHGSYTLVGIGPV